MLISVCLNIRYYFTSPITALLSLMSEEKDVVQKYVIKFLCHPSSFSTPRIWPSLSQLSMPLGYSFLWSTSLSYQTKSPHRTHQQFHVSQYNIITFTDEI
ncbi:hypothetical protein CHUAL_014101 [Chamberlinius hualienensis]